MRRYAGTFDEEVYVPAQATTANGSAVITIEHVAGGANATAPSQQPDGSVWNVSKAYKSGFVTSWNKASVRPRARVKGGGHLDAICTLPASRTRPNVQTCPPPRPHLRNATVLLHWSAVLVQGGRALPAVLRLPSMSAHDC